MVRLSICIPAFNRPAELAQALASAAVQDLSACEIVVAEDHSPRRDEIAAVCSAFAAAHPDIRFRFHANPQNLGYDANLRGLFDLATGEHCMLLGDDDVLTPDAVALVLGVLERPGVGFILRPWEAWDMEQGRRRTSHRYFRGDRLFAPGTASVAALYRRSVFLSGLVLHRQAARAQATAEFDGLLFYQLYMMACVLQTMQGYYLDRVIVRRRVGTPHNFGSSDSEAKHFRPGFVDAGHCLVFCRGMLVIADALEAMHPGVARAIRQDLSRYSYGTIEAHAEHLSRLGLLRQLPVLARLGFAGHPLFYAYGAALVLLGPQGCRGLIERGKLLLGVIPGLGGTGGTAL